jgi:hypothetical protein
MGFGSRASPDLKLSRDVGSDVEFCSGISSLFPLCSTAPSHPFYLFCLTLLFTHYYPYMYYLFSEYFLLSLIISIIPLLSCLIINTILIVLYIYSSLSPLFPRCSAARFLPLFPMYPYTDNAQLLSPLQIVFNPIHSLLPIFLIHIFRLFSSPQSHIPFPIKRIFTSFTLCSRAMNFLIHSRPSLISRMTQKVQVLLNTSMYKIVQKSTQTFYFTARFFCFVICYH